MGKWGERIKALREEAHINQGDFAKRLGTSRYSVIRWEAEETNPGPDHIIEMARIFGVTTDYLLGVSDVRLPDPTAPLPDPERRFIRSCIDHLIKNSAH